MAPVAASKLVPSTFKFEVLADKSKNKAACSDAGVQFNKSACIKSVTQGSASTMICAPREFTSKLWLLSQVL
jgi:hypothetical protein